MVRVTLGSLPEWIRVSNLFRTCVGCSTIPRNNNIIDAYKALELNFETELETINSQDSDGSECGEDDDWQTKTIDVASQFIPPSSQKVDSFDSACHLLHVVEYWDYPPIVLTSLFDWLYSNRKTIKIQKLQECTKTYAQDLEVIHKKRTKTYQIIFEHASNTTQSSFMDVQHHQSIALFAMIWAYEKRSVFPKPYTSLLAGQYGMRYVSALLYCNIPVDPQCIVFASNKGYLDVVEVLMHIGFIPPKQTLEVAVKGGHTKMIKPLIDTGGLLTSSLVNEAIENNASVPEIALEVVHKLLECGITPNSDMLGAAIEYNLADIVQLLLDQGVSFQIEHVYSAFQSGEIKWSYQVCTVLESIFPQHQGRLCTFLRLSLQKSKIEFARYILKFISTITSVIVHTAIDLQQCTPFSLIQELVNKLDIKSDISINTITKALVQYPLQVAELLMTKCQSTPTPTNYIYMFLPHEHETFAKILFMTRHKFVIHCGLLWNLIEQRQYKYIFHIIRNYSLFAGQFSLRNIQDSLCKNEVPSEIIQFMIQHCRSLFVQEFNIFITNALRAERFQDIEWLLGIDKKQRQYGKTIKAILFHPMCPVSLIQCVLNNISVICIYNYYQDTSLKDYLKSTSFTSRSSAGDHKINRCDLHLCTNTIVVQTILQHFQNKKDFKSFLYLQWESSFIIEMILSVFPDHASNLARFYFRCLCQTSNPHPNIIKHIFHILNHQNTTISSELCKQSPSRYWKDAPKGFVLELMNLIWTKTDKKILNENGLIIMHQLYAKQQLELFRHFITFTQHKYNTRFISSYAHYSGTSTFLTNDDPQWLEALLYGESSEFNRFQPYFFKCLWEKLIDKRCSKMVQWAKLKQIPCKHHIIFKVHDSLSNVRYIQEQIEFLHSNHIHHYSFEPYLKDNIVKLIESSIEPNDVLWILNTFKPTKQETISTFQYLFNVKFVNHFGYEYNCHSIHNLKNRLAVFCQYFAEKCGGRGTLIESQIQLQKSSYIHDSQLASIIYNGLYSS